ncbi:MAG: BrnA antitoxin family protein [Candidatus Hydrogenedens sp.]|nr:BrnA antitoxin family protein [Candidatus Hydrogenedentota bacterium]NLF58336.1 BrnA antitoxin family protein [Candidatus Hydrogenedens sp.]
MGNTDMQSEYDLSKMKSRKNPYARKLKKQVTLRLDPEVIEYFKEKSGDTGIPYQTLINLYLLDCRATHRALKMTWSP